MQALSISSWSKSTVNTGAQSSFHKIELAPNTRDSNKISETIGILFSRVFHTYLNAHTFLSRMRNLKARKRDTPMTAQLFVLLDFQRALHLSKNFGATELACLSGSDLPLKFWRCTQNLIISLCVLRIVYFIVHGDLEKIISYSYFSSNEKKVVLLL